MGTPEDGTLDPRSLPKTPEGIREAWALLERTWSETTDRALRLPASALRERVEGEWSFAETLRHLVFATDAWIGRAVLGDRNPYHRLGMPPDHRIGEADPAFDVSPWGIDVHAEASIEEVLEARTSRQVAVREVVDGLTDDELGRTCAPNPAPGFPPSTVVPVALCLGVVIGEEWAHHGYAVRDLEVLRRSG